MRRFPFACVIATACLTAGLASAQNLPQTKPLTLDRPLHEVMVEGIDRFCLRELEESVAMRAQYWKRDASSPEAYEMSVAPNRERLKIIIGAVDPRVGAKGIELIATTGQSAIVATREGVTISSVRWQVLNGVTAEGLLLQPEKPIARMVVLPDADWTPEAFSGIGPGVPAVSQLPARLAAAGVQVLVPTLISRDDSFSGSPDIALTNQTHREWIYRQGFELGRHVIGYEVQKVQAAVDEFTKLNETEETKLPIAVAGIGEGGLLALYSAAVDTRIQAALVCGYFGPREGLWQEPIYRNVWALLREFGDAELASLVAPRALIVEACTTPTSDGPPAVKPGRRGGAAPGVIRAPELAAVTKEVDRANKLTGRESVRVFGPGSTQSLAGETIALSTVLVECGLAPKIPGQVPAATDARAGFDPNDRQRRQVQELVDFTQRILRFSWRDRERLWSKADRSSVDAWAKTAEFYRDYVYDEMIGRLPAPTMEPNVRSRKVLDEPEYTGYEVVIDVYPDVIAGGILLLPKNLKEGEKRPAVVCQHGLEGVPMDTISKDSAGYPYYKAFTAELAKRGFITYAPQNPYKGQDKFRTLQRKSNPLKRSLFSYIIPQHQRTLDFLKALPNVDPQRIGFYGLSYGGKTAVRVPPMLKDYALSICSADFNEWVYKNCSVDNATCYMYTGEYEIFEWNMGGVANYAELSYLMTPRPFMVERGHTDGVGLDEWVAWEYAKVFRHYDFVGLHGKTEMEVFNGPHTINGVGTYDFLHRHLNWPKKEVAKQ